MHDLEGRVAVVTGAAGGIGEGLARAASTAGMKVVLADIEAANAERAADSIRESGGEALGIGCDVSDLVSEMYNSVRASQPCTVHNILATVMETYVTTLRVRTGISESMKSRLG